jgi:hypothetical protein
VVEAVEAPSVAVLSSTERDCDVVQDKETSDLALSSSSGSLDAKRLCRLPLRIFCKQTNMAT